jgi:hypothetical protein
MWQVDAGSLGVGKPNPGAARVLHSSLFHANRLETGSPCPRAPQPKDDDEDEED